MFFLKRKYDYQEVRGAMLLRGCSRREAIKWLKSEPSEEEILSVNEFTRHSPRLLRSHIKRKRREQAWKRWKDHEAKLASCITQDTSCVRGSQLEFGSGAQLDK